jgi:HSP20 family protein
MGEQFPGGEEPATEEERGMAMERWRPFGSRWEEIGGLGDIQTEMNRLFDTFFGRPAGVGVSERVWSPPVDIYETRDDLVVACDLPGVRETEVTVSITGDVLTLKGERKAQGGSKDESYHRLERWYGRFERHISLPVPVQADKVRATYRDGILEIRLPKAEEIKPREIKIDLL